MTDETYDVAVLGAGPAGATAACVLAEKERRVVLLDRQTFPRSVVCSGWVSARVVPLLKECGVDVRGMFSQPFRDVTLHNADYSKMSRPAFSEAPGFLVDRGRFDHGLVKAAVKKGVTFVEDFSVSDVRLHESSVTVEAVDGRSVRSQLLILASGRDTPIATRVGFPPPSAEQPVWTAHVAAPLKGAAAPKEPRVAIVLGLDGGDSLGFCCVGTDRVSVNVHWCGDRSDVPEALASLCRSAYANNLTPVDLTDATGEAIVMRCPAGSSLDFESHVHKHTLVIGDAGGFLSAVSNEGIYPAMWSAVIAADVMHLALSSEHSQDALMAFDSRWRVEMADYMRPPHTDIRFLLPLIFANQPMADRMGAAFFFGENI